MASKEAIKFAKKHGFRFLEYAKGSHQIWVHPITRKTILVATSKKGWHGWKAFKRDVLRRSKSEDI